MEFSVARPDVIRAVSQRWLLKAWIHDKKANRIPLWQGVNADDLSRIAGNLSILQAVGGNGSVRFLIRFHGKAIAEAYGSSDCTGKYLDEVIPASDGTIAHLTPYHRALDSGQPIYTIHDVTGRDRRVVHYERLLLPYGRDGQTVDHILAAFEFVCADGGFDRQALMKMPAMPPTLRLSAVIAPPS